MLRMRSRPATEPVAIFVPYLIAVRLTLFLTLSVALGVSQVDGLLDQECLVLSLFGGTQSHDFLTISIFVTGSDRY